jgi:hypothetical protein
MTRDGIGVREAKIRAAGFVTGPGQAANLAESKENSAEVEYGNVKERTEFFSAETEFLAPIGEARNSIPRIWTVKLSYDRRFARARDSVKEQTP